MLHFPGFVVLHSFSLRKFVRNTTMNKTNCPNVKGSRKPSIYADAAYAVLKRDSSSCTGNFFLDQDVLEEEGVTDFDQYAIEPGQQLVSDFFVDDNPEEWMQL